MADSTGPDQGPTQVPMRCAVAAENTGHGPPVLPESSLSQGWTDQPCSCKGRWHYADEEYQCFVFTQYMINSPACDCILTAEMERGRATARGQGQQSADCDASAALHAWNVSRLFTNRNFDEQQEPNEFSRYLSRMAWNAAREYYRSFYLSVNGLILPVSFGNPDDGLEAGAVPEPADQSESQRQTEDSIEELAELLPDGHPPGRDRLIFILRHKDFLTHAKIAQQLGCDRGTVARSMKRSYQFLRDSLDQCDG